MIVDVDVSVVKGVVRLKHSQAFEISEVAKAVMYDGNACALYSSSSGASSAAER